MHGSRTESRTSSAMEAESFRPGALPSNTGMHTDTGAAGAGDAQDVIPMQCCKAKVSVAAIGEVWGLRCQRCPWVS
jgi:hypothetical protein